MADLSYFHQSCGATADLSGLGTMVGSRYFALGGWANTNGTNILTKANFLYAVPYVSGGAGIVDRIGVQVNVSGGGVRAQLGIYGVGCFTLPYPASVCLVGSDVSLAATGAQNIFIIHSMVAGGLYYLALLANGVAQLETLDPTNSPYSNILGMDVQSSKAPWTMFTASYAYGLLPATFPTSATLVSSAPPAIGLRYYMSF